jgi:EmrB/QacA subfamily drug resistance transporter
VRIRTARHPEGTDSSGWCALLAPYLGASLTVIDATVVNVALPSIQDDLHLSASALIWVVNAYQVPYGGFLLLCGRLGDQYGHRSILLHGMALFLLASVVGGIATSPWMLVGARAAQGIGGAAITAVALPLVWREFQEVSTCAQALALYALVSAAGSSTGALLGGALTSALSWRWIFWINLPIGACACALWWLYPPRRDQVLRTGDLDVAGAVLMTASITSVLFGVLNAAKTGLWSLPAQASFCGGLLSFVLFILAEWRAPSPVCPSTLFRYGNFSISLLIIALWATAHVTWGFTSALYLQRILGYSALQTGLSFLPAVIVMGALSVSQARNLVVKFGGRLPLSVGLLLVTLGLVLLTQAPVDASFMKSVLPGMLLVGMGSGIAPNAFYFVALSGVSEGDHGVASGAVNSAGVMSSALGLGLIVSLAAYRASELVAAGTGSSSAFNSGYHLAFGVSAICVGTAALLGIALLRGR